MVGSLHDVVGTVFLIGCNEVRVQDSWKGLDLLEVGLQLVKQGGLKNLSAFAGLVKVQIRNVPAANLEINGLDHRQKVLDGLVDVSQLAVLLVEFETNMGGSALGK